MGCVATVHWRRSSGTSYEPPVRRVHTPHFYALRYTVLYGTVRCTPCSTFPKLLYLTSTVPSTYSQYLNCSVNISCLFSEKINTARQLQTPPKTSIIIHVSIIPSLTLRTRTTQLRATSPLQRSSATIARNHRHSHSNRRKTNNNKCNVKSSHFLSSLSTYTNSHDSP